MDHSTSSLNCAPSTSGLSSLPTPNDASSTQSNPWPAAGPSSAEDSGTRKPSHTRINLACLKCRSRRARCSGTRPTCTSCAKTDSICVWPDGRRRKRTRAEMQEAEKQQKMEARTAGGAPPPPLLPPSVGLSASASESYGNQAPQGLPFNMPVLSHPQQQTPHAISPALSHFQPTLPPASVPHPLPVASTSAAASLSTQDHYTAFDFTTFNPLANDMFAWAPQSTFDPLSTMGEPPPLSASAPPDQLPQPQQQRKDPSRTEEEDAPAQASVQHADAPSSVNQDELLRALGSQQVFIEGDPSNSETIDLFYYRVAGSTAIHPGINRINLRLHKANASTSPYTQPPVTPVEDAPLKPHPTGSGSASQKNSPAESASKTPSSLHPDLQPQMFDDAGMPWPTVYEPLLDLFFKRASAFFPSISQKRMAKRLETGTMSAFMMNAICAISARFTPGAANPNSCSAPFFAKAQELLIPLLHLPAHDVVTGLLLLAWAAYGQNSEAACWQFSGVAFRMAIDMGLHENQEIYESKAHLVRTRLLFWSLFVTDRVLSFAYGRPASISEEIIEIPLPGDADYFPDPARDLSEAAAAEPVEPVPFAMLTRLMVQVGRISNVLNGRRGRKRTLVNANDPPPGLLAELQNQLVELYTNMPASMRWSVDNFKHQEARGHGGVFLTLHLWANAVLTLTYHPELMTNPSGTETPFRSSLQRSVNLSLASARLTTECLVYADLCSSSAYTSAPLVVQPIYVAALAFLHEVKLEAFHGNGNGGQDNETRTNQAQSKGSHAAPNNERGNTEAFLASLHKQSLTTLSRALQRIEVYWAGCAYATNILAQRESGLNYFRIDPSLQTKRATISLPDHGLLRRFQTNDPSVNPATATSLRDSIAAEQFTDYSLETLFPNFELQQTFITPATSLDVAQLLNSHESAAA